MNAPQRKKTITAEEVANYVVCPEAWRLKYLLRGKGEQAVRKDTGRAKRQEWIETQDLSLKLRSYAKVAYLLLVVLVIIVFLLEHKRPPTFFPKTPSSMSTAGDARE